jgi:hypothetical protein
MSASLKEIEGIITLEDVKKIIDEAKALQTNETKDSKESDSKNSDKTP